MTQPGQSTEITIPLAPDVFWPLVLLAGLILSVVLLVALMPKASGGQKPTGFDALVINIGLSRVWAGPVLFVCLILLTILGISLFELARGFFRTEFDPQRFGIFASIVTAFMAGLFLGWRNLVLAKQANTQVEALFNDKINAAAADLAARRQVTRVMRDKDGIETILTEWQDDLVTRAAAIDRLEGLAQERKDATPRIARQLSIYVRELSREFPAETPPDRASPGGVRNWASELEVKRPDMEKAAQTLGRLRGIENHGLKRGDIDLRNANLQGFDLAELDFTEVLFDGAELQGAELFRAQMQGAELNRAQMQGAGLLRAQMQEAKLIGARMQGAELELAEMQGAELSWAQMQGAKLNDAQMQGAKLNRAQMQGAELNWAQMQGAVLHRVQMDQDTELEGATLRGAAVRSVDDTTKAQLRPFWADIFANGSVTVPEDARPAHWPKEKLNWIEFDEAWEAWRATLPKEE